MSLATERCEACHAGTPTLGPAEARELATGLDGAWTRGERRLARTVPTSDFAEALATAVRVGMIAEAEGHHPDLTVAWGRLHIELWTHAVDGLTRNDFILAAKIDEALRGDHDGHD